MHFSIFYLAPENMSPAPNTHNQRIQLSWHISQTTPFATQELKDHPKHGQEEHASRNPPEKESSSLNQEDTSQPLTKKPEMLSEELLFVETDFGYQPTGSITLKLTIGKDGSVKSATKTKSTTRPMFEDQVLKHILKSTWSPAEINGSPIETSITVTIDIGS
jgi:TonB family protein